MKNYYGVSQSCHGHEYRWIFDEETLRKELKLKEDQEVEDCNGEDLLFPIGGSNSSCTWFVYLENDDSIKDFLTAEGDGPDFEDPMLVDLAEYILTIATDSDSCTQEFLDKFGLKAEELEKFDDEYRRCEKVELMAKELKAAGYEGLDYDNIFYGDNEDMRYSELCELYEEVTGKEIE